MSKGAFKGISIILVLVIINIAVNPLLYTNSHSGATSELVTEITGMENETGGFIVDNTGDYIITTIDEAATASREDFLKRAIQSFNTKNELQRNGFPNATNYFKNRTNEFTETAKNIRVGRQFLGGAVQILNVYNTTKDTYTLVFEPSKHETTIEKGIDKTLGAIDAGMGWYAIILGAGAIIAAPTVGAGILAAGTVTGTTYFYTKLSVGASRTIFNSETFRNVSGLVRGTKKLVFAPLTRPEVKEGLDIIKEELGFDLYPGMRREIPDPSTGIPVYKPNIYVYSDKDIDLNLKIYPENYITKSIPLYNSAGWDVKIRNGSMQDNEYLFYEAIVPKEEFQLKSGFKIQSETMIDDMKKMMDMFKFNDKETKDFIEYWSDKLNKDTSYVFYPQETQCIDKIMPLVVDKDVDNIFRVWFYIQPGDDCIQYNPNEINRQGTSIIEWGGLIE